MLHGAQFSSVVHEMPVRNSFTGFRRGAPGKEGKREGKKMQV
jgi:hypothetical protein